MSHSKGKPKNRTPRSSETTWPGTTKFGTSSLMSHRGPYTGIGEDRLRGVWLAGWRTLREFGFFLILLLFLLTAHRPNGSADFYVWCLGRRGLAYANRFLGLQFRQISLKGSKSPKNPKILLPEGKFPAKWKMLNNFSSDRDTQKISTHHLYKSDQDKSNGDVSSGEPRPLVAKTTSGWRLAHRLSLITCNLREINAKRVQNTIRKPIAAYRLVMSIPLGGATWGHFRPWSDFKTIKFYVARKWQELHDRNV